MKASSAFPTRLAWWRKRRGLSQFRLATAAACSQRHLSFLELGRTKPSREMVLRLSTALDMPLRQANELLLAAGYAPAWSEADLGAAALAPIRSALDYMLSQQEPFPAVVVDRRWNLLQANKGAVAMVEFLVGPLKPGSRDQPRRRPGRPRRAEAAPDELDGGRPLLRAQRRGRCGGRRHGADRRPPAAAAAIPRRAGGDGAGRTFRRRRPRAADAFPEGADGAQAVHDHRHARHAARRHASGAAGRELLSDGRRDPRCVRPSGAGSASSCPVRSPAAPSTRSR